MSKLKRMYLDLETCPNLAYVWSAGFKITVTHESIYEERRIITAAYNFEGEKKIKVLDWGKDRDDEKLVKELVPAMNEADEIVAHYGDFFDLPWVRTRSLFHGVICPNWKSVDTKAWSSRYFYLNSNKLDYLARFLGIGTKIRTDYDLWKDATHGSDKVAKIALDKMRRYDAHDVELLNPVHERLSLYCPNHTHVGVVEGRERWSCVRCASEHVGESHKLVSKAGIVSHQMHCLDCGKYYNIAHAVWKKFDRR
jgi:hypothetical protein